MTVMIGMIPSRGTSVRTFRFFGCAESESASTSSKKRRFIGRQR